MTTWVWKNRTLADDGWMDGRTDGRAVTDDRPRETRRHQEDKKKEAMKAEKFRSTRERKKGREKKVS